MALLSYRAITQVSSFLQSSGGPTGSPANVFHGGDHPFPEEVFGVMAVMLFLLLPRRLRYLLQVFVASWDAVFPVSRRFSHIPVHPYTARFHPSTASALSSAMT